ncbi:hypothetical protein [Allosphingosinicella indica]|uniref:Uncharacterized protein n=1 Tax=Allosphingosinicella indica TaxID=941907 RepID=A0A1X7GF82_9SPHN|nr:hypothetical protein [Allosphingosinicella indica]SMF68392.1 hypothetical protein SAMN06295910_1620 [Allosphingosinicella indica]
MALSRMTLATALLILPAAGSAQESAVEGKYRALFPTIAELDCPQGSGDDIVVCARKDERRSPRLPLPVEPVEGARVAGMSTTTDTMGPVDHNRCTPVGPNKQCGGGLPIPQAIMLLVEAAKIIADPDR